MDYPKSDPTVGLLNGKFTDADPANNIAASEDPAAWANAVTEELRNVIIDGGLDPAEDIRTQLRDAIHNIIAARAEPWHRNNLAAASNPTINDDANAGYSQGSLWLNGGEFFVCLDATVGAANWQQTTLTIDELGTAATHNLGVNAPDQLPLTEDADNRYGRLGANSYAGQQQATIYRADNFLDTTGTNLNADFEPRQSGDPAVAATNYQRKSDNADLADIYAPISIGGPLGRNTGFQIAAGTDLAAIFAKLGSRPTIKALTVTADAQNFNFKVWADGKTGGDYSLASEVHITVAAGVKLGTALTGVFPVPLRIINQGAIYGTGGAGGAGGNAERTPGGNPSGVNNYPGTTGDPGGPALTLNMDIDLDNGAGKIYGGGGGGHGGNGTETFSTLRGGDGGGGGQGYPGGAGGAAGTAPSGSDSGGSYSGTDGTAGTAGTDTAPGSEGGSVSGTGNDGGDGGAWGAAGGTAGGSSGGAAGKAIEKSGHTLTIIAQGDTKGAIS